MRPNRLLIVPLLLACASWIAACGGTPPTSVEAEAPAAVGVPMPGVDRRAAQAPADADVAPDQASTSPDDAGAASPDDTRARIDTLLGDAGQYEAVFDGFKAAVTADDRTAVVEYLRFPLRVGAGREVADAEAFLRDYDAIVTPDVADAVAAQEFGDLFVNQDGVMIGRGQVWLNGTCLDDACARTEVRVVTIQ
ncbi:hypothetical protein [Coralloluteibacterium stylophorae]|uniref:Uncharacterized protein n=1 Tax=Coralloluteibacterium stylophorae TaxID=1776034 RepID=A0A8J8AWM6_9GAMM|nr:hypothetical protein [Coralloluteibacterium stylophorae]MBS7456004.1 hypothetical protein [Coralloluteibacterium stylophorae]